MRSSVDAAAILRLQSRVRTRTKLRVMTSVVSLLLPVIMVVLVAADKPWVISFVRHPHPDDSIRRRTRKYHCRRHSQFAAVLPDSTPTEKNRTRVGRTLCSDGVTPIHQRQWHQASSSSNWDNDEYRSHDVPLFPYSNPPHLALITMRCSCDSEEHTESALRALHRAVSTGEIDLISVRVNRPLTADRIAAVELRLQTIVQQLLDWSVRYNGFRVVVSSDWIEAGLRAGAHGVHFKETHRDRIPAARRLFGTLHEHGAKNKEPPTMLVGTSTHTVESALEACELYQPDYFFAGTCFETASHPEKTGDALEGPAIPALVVQALEEQQQERQRPKVLAIGGLDATNCGAQVALGSHVANAKADGIATIRAVLEADQPDQAVRMIQENMIMAAAQQQQSSEF